MGKGMPFKPPLRRFLCVLGVCGLLLSGFVLGSGTARALPEPPPAQSLRPNHAPPDPQAVEDASLVVIVRPDGKVPHGYRIEEILADQNATNHIGDLVILPGLSLDVPSEDSAETKSPAEDVPEPEEWSEADATPTPQAPTPQAPKNAFPEAPSPPPSVFKWPQPGATPKPKKAKKSRTKTTGPTPTPDPFPEAPPMTPPAGLPLPPSNTIPVSPNNPFPEAPPSSVPALPPSLQPGTLPGAPPGAPPGDVPPVGALPGVDPFSMPNPTLAPTPTPTPVSLDPAQNRRILLYLWYAPDNSGRYSITQDGEAYAWVGDAANIALLRQQAVSALGALHDWKLALAVANPRARLAALWPFLSGYDGRYNALAQRQLRRIGVSAGDYIAARWSQTDSSLRMTLLPNLASYHSEALHRKLLAHLQSLQPRYERYLVSLEKPDRERADDWADLPEKIKSLYGETYYGLMGLADFRDPRDLPYIRALAVWALKYRFKQTDDAALHAFKLMPAEANVLVISDIWREYSTRPIPGNELDVGQVVDTLAAHRFPATVPQLALFLRHPNPQIASAARRAMSRIVGRDLGTNPMAWVNWFRAQKPGVTAPTVATKVPKPKTAKQTKRKAAYRNRAR